VVLNCWVTATKDTPWRSNGSNHLGEIRERPGQPVDLVDHHDVDLSIGDVREQPLHGRPLQRAARQTSIIIGGVDQAPALALLAFDERLARLALSMERIEVLLQPLLRGFARIDGTALERRLSRARDALPLLTLFRPKKVGPDQRLPVIVRATSESER